MLPSRKSAAVVLAAVAVMSSGCMTKAGNQADQTRVKTQQAQYQQQGTADNQVQVAEQAATKITELNAVKRANVLVTNHTAYVAAVIDTNAGQVTNQGQMTQDTENQIAQQVRAADPSVQNVYVSTNPEFVDRVNQYVGDVKQGKPVTGFVQEFGQMIQRIFPNAR